MQAKNSTYVQIFSNRLNILVKNRYDGTWARLAEAIGQSKGAFGRYVRGEGLPGAEVVERICALSGVSPTWLVLGEGPMMRGKSTVDAAGLRWVPAMDVRLSAGNGNYPTPAEPMDAIPYREADLRRLADSPGDVRVVWVEGDSMWPTLGPGDRLAVDTSVRYVRVDGIYAVMLEGLLAVKRLARLPGGIVRVISDNSAYPAFDAPRTDGDFLVLGRVVEITKRS